MGARRWLRGVWLGRRPYAPVYDLQQQIRDRRLAGDTPDTLLLLEHEPVVTLGRGARASNLLASEAVLSSRGVSLERTDRGGDITLHAPGQLVGYPIVDLKPDRCDVRRYVHDLAMVMADVVHPLGVSAGAHPDFVGLWVDSAHPERWPGAERAVRLEKLGAIGVRLSRWITMHGFALNLSTSLELFDLIVPCGIQHYGVTSVERLVGSAPTVERAAGRALEAFAARFGFQTHELEDWSSSTLRSFDRGAAARSPLGASRPSDSGD